LTKRNLSKNIHPNKKKLGYYVFLKKIVCL